MWIWGQSEDNGGWLWGHPGDTLGTPRGHREGVALGTPRGHPEDTPGTPQGHPGAASPGQDVLSLLVSPGSAVPTGVLVPAPGPPLAALAAGLAGAVPVPYPLDEAREGAPDVAAIRRELRDARGRCTPKVLWVGNPGHPTGPALSLPSMLALLSLAFEESLLLLADEVGQPQCPQCPQCP
ncbi:PREDICTED: alanine aminotransferase 1-like, partial [Lepidothrix coronata]|uniref:alanine transaminase n=1 Tax=Lepidothrix coronata TaxID=321398 RepID=A0A6J0J865_9PASS